MILPKHVFGVPGRQLREAPANLKPVGGPYRYVDFKPGD